MDLYYIGLSLVSNSSQKAPSKRALLSAEGRRMLALLIGRPLLDLNFAFEENGRPYFPDRSADFNISHSGNMAAISFLSLNGLERRTCCDIQLVKPRSNAREIAEKFFHPAEIDYIFSGGDQARFFSIWTLKECYLKLKGLSVFDMEKAPSFICNRAFCVQNPFSFVLYELKGKNEQYMLAAAAEGLKTLKPVIRWFSESSMPCKKIAESFSG